jgi:hypothetical protein
MFDDCECMMERKTKKKEEERVLGIMMRFWSMIYESLQKKEKEEENEKGREKGPKRNTAIMNASLHLFCR